MDSYEQSQTCSISPQPSSTGAEPTWHTFTPSDNDHRYLRKRTALLNAAFNSQPLTVTLQERRQAWHDLTSQTPINGNEIEAPLVRSPFYVDYGVNVHIDPSAVIDRCCCFQDCPLPEAGIWVGEGTYVGVGVFIGTLKMEEDWRKRDGVFGPALAAEVRIGKDCIVGAESIIRPGVVIGDGCVIGPGSVVTRSIPACHVANGNPAKPVRKVAHDVPDGPGLQCEMRDDREFVVHHSPSEGQSSEGEFLLTLKRYLSSLSDITSIPETWYRNREDTCSQTVSSQDLHTGTQFNGDAYDRLLIDRLTSAFMSQRRADSRAVVLDVCMLVLAVFGGWLILHSVLY